MFLPSINVKSRLEIPDTPIEPTWEPHTPKAELTCAYIAIAPSMFSPDIEKTAGGFEIPSGANRSPSTIQVLPLPPSVIVNGIYPNMDGPGAGKMVPNAVPPRSELTMLERSSASKRLGSSARVTGTDSVV